MGIARRAGPRLLVLLPCALVAAVLVGPAATARADAADPSRRQRLGPDEADGGSGCRRPFTARDAFRSEASLDLYNGLLWLGGAGAIEYGTTAEGRWRRTNGFDRGIRSGLKAGSASSREDADRASDAMLGVSAGLVPLAAVARTWMDGDCQQAWDMATDAFESIALASFLTEAAKSIAGRERPFVRDCDATPPPDARCGDRDRKQSFWSGHAATAAAGAGVHCAWAIKQRTWGESPGERVLPCALGAGAAVTTGVLRVVADEHWGTDVIVGLAVGGVVGYFDTWGPFDLLRFEARSDDRAWELQGLVLPYAADGELGARLRIAF